MKKTGVPSLFLFAARGVLALGALLVLTEVLFYPGIVRNYLFLPAVAWAVIPLGIAWVQKVLVQKRFLPKKQDLSLLPPRLQQIFVFFPTVVLALAFVCTLADYFIYPNYVFSTFSFHPEGLLPIGMYLLGMLFFLSPKKIRVQQAPLWLFLLPFWLFFLVFPVRWIYEDLWRDIVKEDQLIEYLTAITYVLGGMVAAFGAWLLVKMNGKKAKKLTASLRYPLMIALLLLGIGCFLIAADEISWGQRLLGVETPENLAALNTQQELNFHNNRAVFGYVYIAYGVVAFLGMTAWVYRWLVRQLLPNTWVEKLSSYVLPPWTTAGWFLPTFVFTRLRTEPVPPEIILWEEFTELFLAGGIALSIFWIVWKVRKQSPRK